MMNPKKLISKGILFAFALSMLISVSSQAQDEGAKADCAPGYKHDSAKSECVACNQPCETGKPGVCGRGIMDCREDTPVCASAIGPSERMEVCNGEDDDCDGETDEGFDKDKDAYTTCSGDCDDRNPNIHPDAVERCDGIDNDCDGLIDEGFNIGAACTDGLGECAREGKRRCQKTETDAECDAVPGTPSPEVCDGRDNDCNGQVDDGLGMATCGVGACKRTASICVKGSTDRCVPGEPSAEICGDGTDNDCDGGTDEGFASLGAECFAGVGACRSPGKKICSDDKQELVCSAVPGPPRDEICGNGIDDDCNGTIDADVAGLGDPCTNNLLGECLREGKEACDRKTAALVCQAPPVAPQPERCDGRDNDCDGAIDNGVSETVSCGKGKCAGGKRERVCSDGQWSEWSACSTDVVAAQEICGNRVDDDCDGQTDADAPDLGSRCDNGLIGACFREGKLQCSGEDGRLACSAQQVEPSLEICNGIDDDCDGTIDEGVTNACGGCGELPGELGGQCHVPGGDECAAGVWVCKQAPERGMECALDAKRSDGNECHSDGNPCTTDVCRHGRCSNLPIADGLACDDGDLCTDDDVCIGGDCAGGARLSCNDGNPCTVDDCDRVHGCYHGTVGGGVPNACRGCEVLKSFPGESCVLKDKVGACREGAYMCQPDGTILCVQSVFEGLEECNAKDDDCDGETDEGFGTSTCGIGACRVTTDNCDKGRLTTCVPRDPVPETCSNMGSDDDCNDIDDDIAMLRQECPVVIGECVIPGQKKCVGDAEFPICVAEDRSDAEDSDGDGVANYCDRGDSIAGGIEMDVSGKLQRTGEAASSARLFDVSKTRAVMLPWQDVYDAAVIAPDSPDQAMVLASGTDGSRGGIAAIRAKDLTSGAQLAFQSCFARAGSEPAHLIAIGDVADIVASSGKHYIVYPKIAAQIPSALVSTHSCELRGIPILAQPARTWQEKGREGTCDVERIFALETIRRSPVMFAGLVECLVPSASIWKKQGRIFGVDIFRQNGDGTFNHEFVPIAEGTEDAESASLAASENEKGGEFYLSVRRDGRENIGICQAADEGWNCWSAGSEKLTGKIVHMISLGTYGGKFKLLSIDDAGAASEIILDAVKKDVDVYKAGRAIEKGDKGPIAEVFEFPGEKDRLPTFLIAGAESMTSAILRVKSDGSVSLSPAANERYLPESMQDDVFVGGKYGLAGPHSMAQLPLKNYGGRDLFVAFGIEKRFSKVGEMGFFYWNANESPTGSLFDIKFDGRAGSASLAFEDPSGDLLNYRASMRAGHGGSLNNWIDSFRGGRLAFSVKGDASAVGLWPVSIKVEAYDAGGLISISKAVLGRDGTVEMISESAGGN